MAINVRTEVDISGVTRMAVSISAVTFSSAPLGGQVGFYGGSGTIRDERSSAVHNRRHVLGLLGLSLLGAAGCSGNTITLPNGSTVKAPEGVSIPKVTIPKGGTIPPIDPSKLPKIDPSKLPKLPDGALPEVQFPENRYPTQRDPATPGVKVQKGPDAVIYTVASDVSFDFDSDTLKPDAQQALKNVVEQIKQKYTNSTLESRGHTDAVGSGEYNMALSNRRAQSVKRYLASQGIAESRIKTVGFGETVPIDSNDTEEGRSHNRRAEVVVVTRQPAPTTSSATTLVPPVTPKK